MNALVFGLSVALTAVLTALVCLLVQKRKKPTRSASVPDKPRKTSNTVLIILGLFVLAFILVMIVTYWRFQSVPDVLIQYTLGAGGVEAFALAAIKISKTFKGGNKHE